ncbi:MAG: SulP family sulfate permease, partial [Mariniblastus sp.]
MLNFFSPQSGSFKKDVLSGVTVSLALVPEAIAFAFVAGVSPLIGLYSAFFLGLITAIFGGRPGMISGATGAMAVVIVGLVSIHGPEYLFPTVILCGILQIAIGVGRLGKLIRMVPHSVMLGFVNGLAIVIGLAQLSSFQIVADGELVFLSGTRLWLMFGLIGLTMFIIWGLPKLTRAVPASLVAILTVTFLAIGINTFSASETNQVATVGDMLHTRNEVNRLGLDQAHHVEDEDSESEQALPHSGLAKAGVAGTENPNINLVSLSLISTDDSTSDKASDDLAATEESTDVAAQENADSGISGGLPQLFFLQYELVPMNWKTLKIIFPFAIVLCG